MKPTPHFITATNRQTGNTGEFEYLAYSEGHAKQMFKAQYPAWKIKSIGTAMTPIYKGIILATCLAMTGVAAVRHLPEAYPQIDFPFESSENHVND